MSSPPKRSGSGSAQQRKDTARVLHTMVPGIPPPVVNFCLDIAFGPGDGASASTSALARTGSNGSPRQGGSRFTTRSANLDDGESSPGRFKLRRMDSGPLGQHSLTSPIGWKGDKRGFGDSQKLFFDLPVEHPVLSR